MRRLLACCSLMLLYAWVTLAHAAGDPRATAKEHFDRALVLVDQGKHAEAAAELRLAYEASPHYAVLYNLGQAYASAGDPVKAVDAFTRYLAEGKGKITSDRERAVRKAVEEQRALIGSVNVTVTPEGETAVRIDGARIEGFVAGAPIAVAGGTHLFAAERAGFRTAEVSAVVYAGKATPVELVLEPLAPPAPVPAPVPLPAPVATSVPAPVPPPPPTEDGDDQGSGPSAKRIAAYSLAGAGVAFGAVAIGLLVHNDGQFADWEAEQRAIDQGYGGGSLDAGLATRQDASDETLASIHALDTLTVTLAAVGGAAVLGGVGLLVADLVTGGEADAGAPTAFVGPHGGGIEWRARW